MSPISEPPTVYRVYCYDGSKMTLTGDLIQASSDEDAIAKAEARGFGSRCEIWDGNRLVAELQGERRLG